LKAALEEAGPELPGSVVEIGRELLSHIDALEARIDGLSARLRAEARRDETARRLMTIPGVGIVTALSWVLEIGDPHRFSAIRQAISYCGLCSAQKESAGKNKRGPISKKRNKHLQRVLVEAAKIAPMWNEDLALVHSRELDRGNRNRATLAVARKLVAYMMAVDKGQKEFENRKCS
jgi:transposase